MTEEIKIIEQMQAVVAQMRQDDIDENPQTLDEVFTCSACGKQKDYAGSIVYEGYRLCNDCVLLAETGLALKKFESIQTLIKAMEDKRLEELCDFIKKDEQSTNN